MFMWRDRWLMKQCICAEKGGGLRVNEAESLYSER